MRLERYGIERDTLDRLATVLQTLGGISEALTPAEMIRQIENKISLDRAYYESDEGAEFINPYITYIGYRHFNNVAHLVSIKCKNVKTLGVQALRYCSNLASVELPSLTLAQDGCFYGPNNVVSFDLQELVTTEKNAFRDCVNATSFNLPKLKTVETTCFCGCTALGSISLPSATYIGGGAFRDCNALEYVVLSGREVCTLGSHPFSSSTIGASFRAFYVPDELVSVYRATTNWTVYADYILPLSELEAEE